MLREKTSALLVVTLLATLAGLNHTASAADPQYKLLKQIPIGGASGWDYLFADSVGRRLYVTHGTKVVVIDIDKDKPVGDILDTPGVHGFVAAPELKRGFSSNGQENKSSIVDLETLKTISKVPTGGNPDALLYEPTSGEVWIFNGRTNSATVIDAKTGKVIVESIPVGGRPESGVADEHNVYVNLENKDEVAVIDIKEHKVTANWPIAPATAATGLALDAKLHRLIIGGSNSKMVMMDSTNGKVIASVDCGQGVDAAAFDPETHLAFVSAGGSGTVTVAKVEADKLTVVQTLTTERGARTMTVDTKTHRIYLITATFKAPAPGDAGASRRPTMEPNSAVILVYGP